MVNEEETWYPMKGFEGLYEISDYGRIKNLNYYGCGKVKILELSAKDGKYIKVGLYKEGKVYYKRVHRLVAETFLPPPQAGQTQVDHISGDKQDNRAVNIRYVSPKDNSNNPNTRHRGYHLSDEVRARMSAAQKKRFREHPEDLLKMWEGKRRKNKKSH